MESKTTHLAFIQNDFYPKIYKFNVKHSLLSLIMIFRVFWNLTQQIQHQQSAVRSENAEQVWFGNCHSFNKIFKIIDNWRIMTMMTMDINNLVLLQIDPSPKTFVLYVYWFCGNTGKIMLLMKMMMLKW